MRGVKLFGGLVLEQGFSCHDDTTKLLSVYGACSAECCLEPEIHGCIQSDCQEEAEDEDTCN